MLMRELGIMVEESNYFDLGNEAVHGDHATWKKFEIGERVNIGALSHIGNRVKIGRNQEFRARFTSPTRRNWYLFYDLVP